MKTVTRSHTPRRVRTFGLRTRILSTFGLGSLALSTFLALSTYNFTRSNLVEERESSAIVKAQQDADRLRNDLESNPTSVQSAIERLGAERPLVYFRGTWTGDDARFSSTAIPTSMLDAVLDRREPSVMRTEVDGELKIGRASCRERVS